MLTGCNLLFTLLMQVTVDKIMKEKGVTADHLRKLCGLPISTYFSALKVSAVMILFLLVIYRANCTWAR